MHREVKYKSDEGSVYLRLQVPCLQYPNLRRF